MHRPANTSSASLPIVVGITGHRNINAEDAPTLRRSIESIFDELLEFAAGPIRLVSPLAEGADQLVAELALARGFECVAPLPMEPGTYELEFSSDVTRETFRSQLERSSWYIAPGLRDSRSVSMERDSRYLAAGHAVASGAHVLIALWDGDEGSSGGTADVVKRSLEPERWADAVDIDRISDIDGCIVYHVQTPRGSTGATKAGEVRRLVPIAWTSSAADDRSSGLHVSTDAVRRLLLPLRTYNLDATSVTPSVSEAHLASFSFSEADLTSDPTLRHAISVFGATDVLARRFRNWARWRVAGRLVLLALGLLLFEVYSGPVRPMPLTLLTSLALVGLAMWGFSTRSREWDKRHLDYRTLCECLRVFLHLRRAGICDTDVARFMRYHARHMDWVHLALHGFCRPTNADVQSRREDLRAVQRNWIQAQHRYFALSAPLERRRQRAMLLAGVAAIGAAGVLVVAAAMWCATSSGPRDPVQWVLTAAVVCVIAAGMFRAFVGYRAFAEHANRFSLMETLFATADRAMQAALEHDDVDRGRRTLEFIASRALQEVSDWLILHRERPPDVHPS